MRKLLVFFLIASSFQGLGQDKGAISLEIAGVGGFGSVSYSKEFKKWDKLGLEYRVGLSFMPIDRNNGNAIIFPLMIHGVYGNGKHRADAGIGQSLTITTKGSVFLRMPASFGYRFQTEGHFFYRFAYTPIVSYIYNFQWEHWGGVTIGYNL